MGFHLDDVDMYDGRDIEYLLLDASRTKGRSEQHSYHYKGVLFTIGILLLLTNALWLYRVEWFVAACGNSDILDLDYCTWF